jgi:predicted restriction endonuclease
VNPSITLRQHNELYPANGSRGKYHNIRVHARKVVKEANLEKKCIKCGYDKYVEVCHIKAIANHSLDDTVMQINALSNLALLCPNHHWEFDNGFLTLDSK